MQLLRNILFLHTTEEESSHNAWEKSANITHVDTYYDSGAIIFKRGKIYPRTYGATETLDDHC